MDKQLIKQLGKINHGWALFTVDFILPIPLTVFIFWLWFIRCHNSYFAAYVVILPLLFGYIIPGIGTNLLKLWKFKWDFFRIGNYFMHHGFMYAPYFAFSLYITWGEPVEHVTITKFLTIIMSNTFLQCFLTTWHDYWAVKAGMIEINNKPFREGKSAAEIILDYGPIGYALFGFTYAISCVMAYIFFVESRMCSQTIFWFLIVLGLFLMGLSGIHYAWRERKKPTN